MSKRNARSIKLIKSVSQNSQSHSNNSIASYIQHHLYKTKELNNSVRLQYVPVDINKLDRLYIVDAVRGPIQRVHHLIVQ